MTGGTDPEPEGHRPVLLEEAVEALAVRPDGTYVDATFGRGGHSGRILERLGPRGRLIALDRDPQAAAEAHRRFGADGRFHFERCSFDMLQQVTDRLSVTGKLDGVLLDLGVSSPQLDDPNRGFSFQTDGPLDMRMDPDSGESAAAWLAHAPEAEIAQVLKEYGEERFARRIARRIVETRRDTPIERTGQLAEIVAAAVPSRERHKHPATRTFQAIRIRVNDELESLRRCLAQLPALLAPGGRLAVISFHSLEDRLVKRFMREQAEGERLPRGLPVREGRRGQTLRLVGRAVRPAEEEVKANPRARSAVLRMAERLS
ncbi:16S rRNA (cytosine(1402)-N(4))-methyltransferase [Thioalkalivibrio denitrificans]|uniref:Ribosomal RNA small subunit methyltransferase H n=1 Tax=Thioalkalivibrio denitrificans TaxID=108003 RepID=A0A1V3NN71_9GAMM|nr:16S rRNA (cytosine(1402)-N(4))-methyltransferase RsmH [Thioalkalivibrio denitrificans]OOG26464.1 16S rRNA (cytosine(1402)-N(4))-methyltransferase [Thioalkalivibrio denitrificans]